MSFLLLLMVENSCYARSGKVNEAALYSDSSTTAKQENTDRRRTAGIIADHTSIQLNMIPLKWIEKAKSDLHIAYGHTSHGSQITSGLIELTNFRKSPYIYKKGSPKDSLDLRDNPFGGDKDLGNPDHKTWAEETRKYLNGNKDINVVMWSWCGQLSNAGTDYVQNYLSLMQSLETEFPDVTFVYMTGHLDGTGGDWYANDACDYDSNGDKVPDKNWAVEWQDTHKKGVDWFQCTAAHSQPVNANMKAYAMWWLLAELSGWDGEPAALSDNKEQENMSFEFYAERLQTLKLFSGTDKGFELGRTPTRLEGAAMLTRLLGGEQEAESKQYSHPFRDAVKTWGNHYVGYLHQYDVVKGISDKAFGCEKKLESADYVTFMLRILGYSDNTQNGDFTWSNSLEAARDFGIIGKEYCSLLKEESFNRGHMAKLTYLCLNRPLKNNSMTLLEKLVRSGAVNKKAAEDVFLHN